MLLPLVNCNFWNVHSGILDQNRLIVASEYVIKKLMITQIEILLLE